MGDWPALYSTGGKRGNGERWEVGQLRGGGGGGLLPSGSEQHEVLLFGSILQACH